MPRGHRLGDTLPWRLVAHAAMDDKHRMSVTLILDDGRWSIGHPISMGPQQTIIMCTLTVVTRTDNQRHVEDFGLWYRFRTVAVFNLLQVVGPARLDRHNDPRDLIEDEYTRRRAAHRERLGKPPVVAKPTSNASAADPFVLILVAVAVLVVFVVIGWSITRS
jgi:hypothetical protein